MKDYLNKLGIDWRYLAVIAAVILSPFLYNSIRIFWIVDKGESTLAMTHFSTYIQMGMEIVGAFLLIPLFTYKSEEYNKNSLTLFVSISITMIVFMVIGLFISGLLINPMSNLNPTEDKANIMMFMVFQTFTWVLVVYEQYLLADFIIERKLTKAIIFASLSIALKLTIDILLLTNFAIIDYNIISISLSSFISSLVIVVVLIVVHIFNMKNEDNLHWEKFNVDQLKGFYLKGFIPAIELLIRNLCYSLVTLQALLMLGESDWNAWNMGGYIYWMMIFKITSVFDYYLLSDLSMNNENESIKLISFATLEAIIITSLGLILSLTYLPTLIGNDSFKEKAILLSIVNIPVMLLISTQNVFKTKLITANKYVYLLFATLFNLVILYTPLVIIIYGTSISISFWANYLIFGISCLIPSVLTVIASTYIIKREGESK